jgi:phage terminase large subunit-like protein
MFHPNFKPPLGHLLQIDRRRLIDASGQEEILERMNALDEARIAKARDDFCAFMEYCFYDDTTARPVQLQWFHDEWSEAMDEHPRLFIAAPRDHGKTTILAVGRVIWELGRNHNLRIKVVCASDARAKERLYEIKQYISESQRIKDVFPTLEQDQEAEWSKHRVVVKRTIRSGHASVEALGVTSTATGGRADLIIGDDVVDRRNALEYPALRETIKQAWKSDWTNLLEPESRVVVIGTLWHKDDLNHELLANPAYHTLFYAVPADFGSLWPDKWSEEKLRKRCEEIGSIEFNRAFRNVPNDESAALIHASWIRFYREGDLPDDLEYLTSYDTAKGLTSAHDFTAGVVLGISKKLQRVYVVDAWHARVTMKRQADLVHDEWVRWHSDPVMVECVGQASLDQWLLEAYPEMKTCLMVTHPRAGESKRIRLANVTPLFEKGQVLFAPHLNPDTAEWEPSRGNIVAELLEFGFGKHDDMVDSLSQGLGRAWIMLQSKGRRPKVRALLLGSDSDEARKVQRKVDRTMISVT